MLETHSQAFKDLIAKGRSDKAIEDLAIFMQSLSDQRSKNDLAQLSARWKSNERANNLGTLASSEYNAEKNKINKALIELLDEINSETQNEHNRNQTHKETIEAVGTAELTKGDMRKLIYERDFEKAFKLLLNKAERFGDGDIYYQVKALCESWNINNRILDLNPQGSPDFTIKQNSIIEKIILLNNQMEEVKSSNNKHQLNIPSSSHSGGGINGAWKKWAIIFAGILASLGALAEFTGWNARDFFNAHSDSSLQLTVYVQTADGKPVSELQNKGKIFVDFGNDRRGPLIGENGRTNLGEIPEKFKSQQVPIIFQADGYESVDPDKKYVMDGKPVYIYVEQDNRLGLVQGIVKDRTGEHFISSALVMVDNDAVLITDSLGRFHLQLPKAKQRERYLITVNKEGYKSWSDFYIPKTGSMEIRINDNR